MDFLARMIEKYGNEIFPAQDITDNTDSDAPAEAVAPPAA